MGVNTTACIRSVNKAETIADTRSRNRGIGSRGTVIDDGKDLCAGTPAASIPVL